MKYQKEQSILAAFNTMYWLLIAYLYNTYTRQFFIRWEYVMLFFNTRIMQGQDICVAQERICIYARSISLSRPTGLLFNHCD